MRRPVLLILLALLTVPLSAQAPAPLQVPYRQFKLANGLSVILHRDTSIPEAAEAIPGLERPTPDSMAFTSDSMPAAYALYRVLYRHIDAR